MLHNLVKTIINVFDKLIDEVENLTKSVRWNVKKKSFFKIISAGTGADVTAWYASACVIEASWYMQLEVQRTCQGGIKIHGSN